jgi:gas vesicle protein
MGDDMTFLIGFISMMIGACVGAAAMALFAAMRLDDLMTAVEERDTQLKARRAGDA